MTELVSIIIPTYDRVELLSETLQSIMKQQYSNVEIIVIDDGSPNDKTKNLCSAYPKVRYHRIENSGGPAAPRNLGMRSAKGEYIAFVDDDDLWQEEKLRKQLAIFDLNPETDLVHGCCQLMDEDGTLKDEIIGRPGDPAEKTGNVYMRMVGNWTLMTSSVIVRKSLVDKVGYFNEKMPAAGEDMEYWVRCSFHGNFFYMDTPLVYYRIQEGISKLNSKKYIELPGYLLQVVRKARDNRLINSSEFSQLKRQLVRMQIKKGHLGWGANITKLFSLDPYWIFNLNNLKLLIKKFGSAS